MRIKVFNRKAVKKGTNLKKTLVMGTIVAYTFGSMVGAFDDEEIVYNTEVMSSNYVASDPVIMHEEDDYVDTDIVNTPIHLDRQSLDEFTDYIDSIETEYAYSELFGIDEALASEATYEPIKTHAKDVRFQGEFEVDALVNQIIENNEVYYANLGSLQPFYTKMSREDIRSVCTIIIDTVYYQTDLESRDADRIACKLSNLKMFYKSGGAVASVSLDDVFSINPNMVNVAGIIADGQNVERDTIIHEAVHLIQDDCLEQVDKTYTGVSYKDASLPINPLYHSWLIEASAEKTMMNMTGDENIVYGTQIGYMESIALALSISDEYDVHMIENMNLKRDLKGFYSTFNIPKKEVIKLLYAIEIIQSEPVEFKNVLKETYGEELTDEKLLEIKRVLKGNLSESLAKIFYKNLATKVSEGNVTLEDAFYLINVFEADIFRHIRYDNEEKREACRSFIETYIEIQDNFFRSIAKEGLTFEDIVAYYKVYSMRVNYQGEKIEKNCSLVWLSDDKIVYIDERKDDVYSKMIPSLRETLTFDVKKTS